MSFTPIRKDLRGLVTLFPGTYEYHPIADIGATVASGGSFRTKGMLLIPCSMGTLSGIARGSSDNLLERTADVMLKEGRKLILVPKETPLHAIHLENMHTLSKMGVRMLPAMPLSWVSTPSATTLRFRLCVREITADEIAAFLVMIAQ